MPTRRQQVAATAISPGIEERFTTSQRSDLALQSLPDPEPDAPKPSDPETIGIRLRKRRRTDSSPAAESSSAGRRKNLRQSGTVSKHAQPVPQPFTFIPRHDSNQGSQNEQAHDTQGEAGLNVAHPSDERPTIEHPPNAIKSDGKSSGQEEYDSLNLLDMGTFSELGPELYLKAQSLPILDNLATQLLTMLAKTSYREIINIATSPDLHSGQAYATLKTLFDQTKKIYSAYEPFLNSEALGFAGNARVDIIKKVNLATFVSSVFGSQDVGFYHLNENFLDIFLADGGRLLKAQAQLYLDLKTQSYISAVTNGGRNRADVLEDLFPQDLDARLKKRKVGAKQLAPNEAEFIQRAKNRRQALLDEPDTEAAVKALPSKYVWEDFLKDISAYVRKNFEAILGLPARKNHRLSQAQPTLTPDRNQGAQKVSLNDAAQNNLVQGAAGDGTSDEVGNARRGVHVAMQERAANLSMENFGLVDVQYTSQQQDPTPKKVGNPKATQEAQQKTPEIRYHFEHALHPNVPAPPPPQYLQQIQYQTPQQNQWPGGLHQSYNDQQPIPYPTQSAPTQVLYERAREVATAKVSPSNRRSGTPSQRRPWTTEEENSLMAGLDRVKGPHWSQILAMFGPGGTINEVLKDRNQVQLKDKARNLKLFFLKSGIEVPYYLQFVTGELKTRAPGQAAKKEAQERATSDEDRAHIEAVNTLASAHSQGPDQPSTNVADLEGTSFQNANVPTANMDRGHPNGLHTSDSAIDPAIAGNTNTAENAVTSADARPDGIGDMTISASTASQQPHPITAYGSSINLQTEATTSAQTQLGMQLEAATRDNGAIPSSNLDPSLSI